LPGSRALQVVPYPPYYISVFQSPTGIDELRSQAALLTLMAMVETFQSPTGISDLRSRSVRIPQPSTLNPQPAQRPVPYGD